MTLRGSKDKKDGSSSDGASVRPQDGQRHASTESSGAASYRSTDTIKGPFANVRGSGMKVNTATRKLG